jgi:restriction system protein
MPRYWVIAPIESKPSDLFDKVWRYDVDHNLISIGWSELRDVSRMSREELALVVASTYREKPAGTRGLYVNMLWAFYHEISPGDFVVARRGRKTLAAVGEVIQPAVYSPGRNPVISHPNYLEVRWLVQPRDKGFALNVFPRHTLSELSADKYRVLLEGSGMQSVVCNAAEPVEEHNAPVNAEIVLEKYLEDFIVSNFDAIFRGTLNLYEESEEIDGQQYQTEVGAIDILAVEPKSQSFVVVELKKGRPSDQVIGQVLRYMGWVKENLCTNDQRVKGLIICHDPDPKLSYALKMTPNIEVRYYSASFKLGDTFELPIIE